MKKLVKDKKGLSAVVATVLIVLLTIVSVSILAVVVINFTRTNLDEGALCIDVQNEVSFNSERSCFSDSLSKIRIKFGNVKEFNIDEIYLSLEKSDGSFDVYKLKDGESTLEISPDPIILPQSGGGEKEYTINFQTKNARVGVVINGKSCPISDEMTITRRC